MSRLLLTNIEPGTTDEEIRAFLVKYGLPEFDAIEHLPGDGTRPAVELTFNKIGSDILRKLQGRIDHMYWKRRELSAAIMHDRFS